MFSGVAFTMVILIFIIQTRNFIAPMNIAKAHYHSLLRNNMFPTLSVSTASDKHWGEKPWV